MLAVLTPGIAQRSPSAHPVIFVSSYVFLRLFRQPGWVSALQRDKGALDAVLRIFLRVVQQSLVSACPAAAKADPAHLHRGAVAFIHRFNSSLNTHVHFHVCLVDGVFEALADADSVNAPSITFYPAQIDAAAITQMHAQVQTNIRKRLVRAFVARGHLESHDAKDINERGVSSQHGGGFSVDPVCASKPSTVQGWSACCATAHAHRFPSSGSNSAARIGCTAVARATRSQCNPTNTAVNWCSPPMWAR